MLKLTSLCFATSILLQLPAGAVHAQAVAAVQEQSLAARIDSLMTSHYKPTEPGATILVTKDGTTVLRKAYGMADLTRKIALTPEASMRLGSITKQFTAVGILMLAEEGKLALTDPITRFLPDYPVKGKVITIEHLLTHTSGIVSYTSKKDFGAGVGRDITVQKMIDSFKNDPLEFEPGTRYAYNNSGYFLLGAIIEKLSGQSYATFMEQRIFVPLGMTQTAYEGFERGPAQRALGYSKSDGGFKASMPISMSQPYAAGALVSTVDDLARWEAAIADKKLIKPASWTRAHTSYRLADGKPTHYGYGWEVSPLRGVDAVSHGGGIPGFSTHALRVPQEKVFVALLSNADSGLASSSMVANSVAALAIGKPYPVRTAVKLSDSILDAYSGQYKFDEKVTRSVRREGGNLVAQRAGGDPVSLYPFAADEFFLKSSHATIKFTRDAQGTVNRMVVLEEGKETVSERIGTAGAAPASPSLAKP